MRRLDHLRSVKFLRLDISFSQGDEWKALLSEATEGLLSVLIICLGRVRIEPDESPMLGRCC
jgi:hypothetical protein